MVILGPFPDNTATLNAIGAKLSAATITTVAPVLAGGNVAIVAGDSYFAGDARQLAWSNESWPSLAGASITLNVADTNGTILLTTPAITINVNTIQCELTSAQTSALPIPTPHLGRAVYRYSLVATLTNSHTITLTKGNFTVSAKV